ncbi:MAG TPA: hypothetical protein VGD10_09310 [Allosphingosinicella sp.]
MKPDRIHPVPEEPLDEGLFLPSADCPRWAPFAFLAGFAFYPILYLLLT